MAFLTTLKFTAYENARPSLIERRRMKLVDNLNDQLVLLEDPSHAKTRSKWIKEGDEKTFKERKIPVRPWWREMQDGQLAFFIKSGLKKIEFKKGRAPFLCQTDSRYLHLLMG